MNTKERMRQIRTLITKLEKQNVDDFCRQDRRFDSIATRIKLEKMIEDALCEKAGLE